MTNWPRISTSRIFLQSQDICSAHEKLEYQNRDALVLQRKRKFRTTLTSTLIANKPKTAPDAPIEIAFLGRTSQDTTFAPTPVRMYENHSPKFPSSSSTSFPVQPIMVTINSWFLFDHPNKVEEPNLIYNAPTKYIQEKQVT